MTKSNGLESALEGFAQQMFGRSRQAGACVTCGSDKIQREDFRDPLSLKEFGISRMCQKCQDSVFGGSEDYERENILDRDEVNQDFGTIDEEFDYFGKV